ncbi:unnamed protein product [Urochloa humidicola]
MATKSNASSSLSPCIRLVEESLLLPTQDVRLFATTFLLIFAHTFAFIAVAVHFAHPLATSLLTDIKALKTTDTTSYTAAVETTWHHGKKLFLIYLAYVASKLATQLAVALAASAAYSGERLTARKVAKERIGGLLSTAAFAAALEVSLTAALLVPLLIVSSTWTYADSSSAVKSLCGYTVFAVALVLYIYLGTVIPVSVAASAVDNGCHGVWALRRAWRLMRAMKKEEAAVLVFVVNLLPAVIYPAPVYAFASVYPAEEYSRYYYGRYPVERFSLDNALLQGQDVWLLGVVSGSGLPTVGAQLFSMVTATVFCCLSMGTNDGGSTSV